ncbi:MAG: transglutaminase domain-containing protein [Christensenellales bacterium]|jgi:transglutaminase-like putative cysteine protease
MTRKALATILAIALMTAVMLCSVSCGVRFTWRMVTAEPVSSEPGSTATRVPRAAYSAEATPMPSAGTPAPTAGITTGKTAAPTGTPGLSAGTPGKTTSRPTAAATARPTPRPTAVTTAPTTPKPTAAPTAAPDLVVQPGGAPVLDTSTANDEYVRAACNESARIKIGIKKDGGKTAYYDVPSDGMYHKFPITEGAGTYTISLFRNISGSSYAFVTSQTVTVAVEDPYAKYLQSNSVVSWNSGMACVKHAATLMSGKSTEKQKAEAVYQWIVANVKYDFDKLGSLPPGYYSDPETTFSVKKGICLDFAVLYASMLRGNGIHVSVNYGYCDNVNGYHAWNQIYVDGGWYTVDISSDSQYRDMGKPYSMYKDRSLYKTEKVY